MLSSKQVKAVGDMVCNQSETGGVKSRRKAEQTAEERTRLMMIRDVYRESALEQGVCVVLPDGKTPQEVFGNYYASIQSRLSRPNVVVTWMKDLTVQHIEDNNVVVDLSEIHITL